MNLQNIPRFFLKKICKILVLGRCGAFFGSPLSPCGLFSAFSLYLIYLMRHQVHARGGAQGSGYRRKDGNDEMDDFLDNFFLVHGCRMV